MNTLQFNLLATLILGMSMTILVANGIEQFTEMPIPAWGNIK